MGLSISNKTFYSLIKAALMNPNTDKDIFVQAIIKMAGDSTYRSEYLLHLLYEKNVELFDKGDYFKVFPEKYTLNKDYSWDKLKDLSLVSEDGMVYGKIVDDSGWSSDYDPYYGRVKVQMLYHSNDGKELQLKDDELNTSSLIKIKKEDILHFKKLNQKSKENGGDIKTTFENRNEKVEETSENNQEESN